MRSTTLGLLTLLSSLFMYLPASAQILATPEVLNAKEGGEILRTFIPNGWHNVFKEWDKNEGVLEWVPLEQNLLNWQAMITFKLMDKITLVPQEYLQGLQTAIQQQCRYPGHTTLLEDTQNGYPEVIELSWCGQITDVQWGEILLTRVLKGENTLYSITKSWRTQPFQDINNIGMPEEEIQHWINILSRSELCDTRKQNCRSF